MCGTWWGASVAGGVCGKGWCGWQGACMAGGHAWQGACVVGGVHGRGHVWQGPCVAGDMQCNSISLN